MRFSRQEFWSGLPGYLSNPKIKPTSSASSALQVDSLPLSYVGSNKLYWDVKYLEHLPNYQITNVVVKKKNRVEYVISLPYEFLVMFEGPQKEFLFFLL